MVKNWLVLTVAVSVLALFSLVPSQGADCPELHGVGDKEPMWRCTFNVQGTTSEGESVDLDFTSEDPACDTARSFAEEDADNYIEDNCDPEMGPCNLSKSFVECVPLTGVVPPDVLETMKDKAFPLYHYCEHRAVANDGTPLRTIRSATDPEVACENSFAALLKSAEGKGGLAAGTVRLRIESELHVCVARAQAYQRRHLIDYELAGIGEGRVKAEAALARIVERFRETAEVDSVEVLRTKCRNKNPFLFQEQSLCAYRCTTTNQFTITVGRLGDNKDEACAAAAAAADALGDRYGGVISCKRLHVLNP